MKKQLYKCSNCGYTTHGFVGKCPKCNSWNTMDEYDEIEHGKRSISTASKISRLTEISQEREFRIKTDIEEFNRVMGGGLVRDGISILTAKPGAGKSTLLLEVSSDLAQKGYKVLYASGEESPSQIKSRAIRILDKLNENIWIYSTTVLDEVIDQIELIDPDFIIIDSIQTFFLREFKQRPGTPTQTMECAHALTQIAKNPKRPRIVFIVGQMTKDDEIAGLRALEHLVDTVLLIESDDQQELRMLLSTKNRFGSTGEIGFFKMTEKGLKSLDNPSSYFMTQREKNNYVPGSTLSVVREGTRPIILETESLVSKNFMPYPSRISDCIKREQLDTLISIIEQRAKINMIDKNVVIKTTGGIKLKEPASNLSVIMSIVSSIYNIAVAQDTIFIADVGLTGELKNVPAIDQRIREAQRMGFKKIYIPVIKAIDSSQYSINLLKRNNILEIIEELFVIKSKKR